MITDADISAASLWTLCGLGSCQFWRVSQRGEGWLLPNAALAMSGEPHVEMNWAIVAAGEDAEADLRACVRRLRARRLPGYVLLADSVADSLAPIAQEMGLRGPDRTPLMLLCEPEQPTGEPSGLALEVVHDSIGLADAVSVAAAAFDIAPELLVRAWHRILSPFSGVEVHVARDGSGPVSCACSTRTSNVVGIWAMATVPGRQRQGAGRALLSALFSHHATADAFYLFASSAGEPLYKDLGFSVVDNAAYWAVPQS
jgi:GNAT superfamily N-acetyltransferase